MKSGTALLFVAWLLTVMYHLWYIDQDKKKMEILRHDLQVCQTHKR